MTAVMGAALLSWAACVLMLYRWRIWLLYYVLGAAGGTLFAVSLAHDSIVERQLETWTGFSVHALCAALAIPTRIFWRLPGSLLVLVVGQHIGWTVLQITIECSGLLEMVTFASLLLFAPGMPALSKAAWLLAGEAFTFVANVLRVLLIAAVLHWGGKDSIFIAHMVIGRLLFFVLTVWLYWHVFTRGALDRTRIAMRSPPLPAPRKA